MLKNWHSGAAIVRDAPGRVGRSRQCTSIDTARELEGPARLAQLIECSAHVVEFGVTLVDHRMNSSSTWQLHDSSRQFMIDHGKKAAQ
ncbi:MAG: hypothetical protein M3N82_09495 [Pseudomonadota bacterium]|nr:hypothetical protein [Pseudomonadota bacterium]